MTKRTQANIVGYREAARAEKSELKRAKREERRRLRREAPRYSAQLPSWARREPE